MDLFDIAIAKKLAGGGGGDEPVLIDKTITANGTYNASSDNADGYKKVVANVPSVTPTGNINITSTAQTDVSAYATAQVVDADLVASNIKKDVDILGVVGTYEGGGGGGDSLTLLKTADLGTVQTSSTTEATVTQITVNGIDDYEVLIVLCERSEKKFGYHFATISVIFLFNVNASFHVKANGVSASTLINYRDVGNEGVKSKNYGAGIYPSSNPAVSGGNVTITLNKKFGSASNTGTIDGDYTAKVYGAKFADLLNL